MKTFNLISSAICIGDPVMGLTRYDVALVPGCYELGANSLVADNDQANAPSIELDGPFVYVVDASKQEQFEHSFHELGNKCRYNMMEMHARHSVLEAQVNCKVAFYWEHEVAGENREGRYFLDISKIVPTMTRH